MSGDLIQFPDEEHRFTLEEAKALADEWEKHRPKSLGDPRPPKRVKDTDAIKRFRLANVNEPCEDCGLRPGVDPHHISFRSQSGGDTATNLAWLCRPCHDARHGIG